MRLNDNLIDCAELHIVEQESHLLFHALELLSESEADCPSGLEDYFQL